MDYFSYEKLSDDIYVCVSKEHRFGTDAFLLTHFSQYKMNDTVCDLGTGCGIIPMIMSRKMPPKIIYAVDIQANAIKQLEMGIGKSSDITRNVIKPICADLKTLWEGAPEGKLSLVVCNPPYKAYKAGIESELDAQKIARHEIMCSIDDVCKSAAKLLKYGGRLCLCNRSERLSDVISAMKKNNIEPKRVRFVSKNPYYSPWLFLIEGRKGGGSFLKIEPNLYTHSDNGYSDELNKIYGMSNL